MSKKPIKPRSVGERGKSSSYTQQSGRKAAGKKQAARKRAFEPIAPMLASMVEAPFCKEGWIFEPKLDGIRAIAYISDGEVKILSRRGLDLTSRYPQLVESLEKSKIDLILDGEIVAFDERGLTSFQLLQQTSGLRGGSQERREKPDVLIRFYVFDILSLGGEKTIDRDLLERKKLLKQFLVESNEVRRVDDLGADGNRAFAACLESGLEGVIAKRIDSLYLPGKRVKSWLKLKATRSSEFLICGYTEGRGERENSFGALVLGFMNAANQLVYAGSVGTGFNESTREKLFKVMQPLKTANCPFAVRPIAKAIDSWLVPEMVVEIKYAEWTMNSKLRMPVFLQVRTDKKPSEVKPDLVVPISDVSSLNETADKPSIRVADVVPINRKKEQSGEKQSTALRDDLLLQLDNKSDAVELDVQGEIIKLTSLNKILFPGRASIAKPATKRDYISYLIRVSEPLLRFAHGRPLTLIRYPNGTEGQKFFQKHWEKGLPPFVETIEYFSENADADEEYLLCNNLSSLIWCGQVASLEIHAVHSRIDPNPDGGKISKKVKGSLENIETSILNYPDFMVLDLDPYLYSGKEKPNAEPELHRKGFEKTRRLALFLKEMLDNLDMNSFVKTSGKTGLHIYIPIVRNVDNDAVRQLAGTIASHVAKLRPQDVTIDWAVKKRTGRVFFDFNMNARHKTLPVPYSVRATDMATVSVPIAWSELENIYPTDFNIGNIPERLQRVGDLWEKILDVKVDLHKKLLKD